MCGLAFVKSKKKKGKYRPVAQRIADLYRSQIHRGKEGFGYIAIADGRIVNVARATSEVSIMGQLMKEKAGIILFHHRFPTSTKNVLMATHPIFVSNDELTYDYYVAHNGVITNDTKLKLEHEKIGYRYTTQFTEITYAVQAGGKNVEKLTQTSPVFNDSEAFAIELARYLEGKSDSVGIMGAVAFWAVAVRKGTNEVTEIMYGKNFGRDLCIKENNKYIEVSSETGRDVRDMRIFSYMAEDGFETLYEMDFIIDKAEPVRRDVTAGVTQQRIPAVTPGFLPSSQNIESKPMGYTHWAPETVAQRYVYEMLGNHMFTRSQFEHILSYDILTEDAFLETTYDINGIDVDVFVPIKYAGELEGRRLIPVQEFNSIMNTCEFIAGKDGANTHSMRETNANLLQSDYSSPPEDEDVSLATQEYDEETIKELEGLAARLAKLETTSDIVDNLFAEHRIERDYYDRRSNDLLAEYHSIEEKMYTMGVDEGTVERIISDARDVEDYEQSYYQSRGETFDGNEPVIIS